MTGADLFSVAGKVALVTGGAQGMGRMIAEALVRGGATVYVTSRKVEVCSEAAAAMAAFGTCHPLPSDLSTPEAATALAAAVAARQDRLDILVNNAGKTWGAPLEGFPDKAWPGIMAVNVQTPFTLVRDLLPLLKAGASAASPARVVNIGSLAGSVVEPLAAYSYVASKAALHHLSHALAADLAPHRITVNVVVPGYFPTQMTSHIRGEADRLAELERRIPLGRLGTAEDVAGAVLFLCSRAGAYITGAELVVDGGLSGCR